MNKKLRTAEKGGPPDLDLSDKLTNPYLKISASYEMLHVVSESEDLFGIWLRTVRNVGLL